MTEKDFNTNIEMIRPRLVAFASSFMCTGAATAEDMVQDAVLKVWNEDQKRQGLLKQEIANIEALTIVVLKNVCIDYLRSSRVKMGEACRNSDSVALYSEENPQRRMELKERVSQVRNAMSALPKDQQLVMRLREIMGYEFFEIAKIMDTTEGNVRTILCRGRNNLKVSLNK